MPAMMRTLDWVFSDWFSSSTINTFINDETNVILLLIAWAQTGLYICAVSPELTQLSPIIWQWIQANTKHLVIQQANDVETTLYQDKTLF